MVRHNSCRTFECHYIIDAPDCLWFDLGSHGIKMGLIFSDDAYYSISDTSVFWWSLLWLNYPQRFKLSSSIFQLIIILTMFLQILYLFLSCVWLCHPEKAGRQKMKPQSTQSPIENIWLVKNLIDHSMHLFISKLNILCVLCGWV